MQLGFKTVLVLSGGTRREDLLRYAYRPDKVIDPITDLCHKQLAQKIAAEHGETLRSSARARAATPGAPSLR